MNKRKLNKVFDKIKVAANMDYAITNADKYGDCNTCTNYALGCEFGMESKGIWAKHWLKGMNKGVPWKELKTLYIAHDITEEQANILIQVFEENGYDVEPKQYDETKCFKVTEKE